MGAQNFDFALKGFSKWERSVFCQLQSVGHWYSRVPADLMNPGGRRSTSSTPLLGIWPDTILSFAAGPKGLVCWDNVSESGNATELSKSTCITGIEYYKLRFALAVCCQMVQAHHRRGRGIQAEGRRSWSQVAGWSFSDRL